MTTERVEYPPGSIARDGRTGEVTGHMPPGGELRPERRFVNPGKGIDTIVGIKTTVTDGDRRPVFMGKAVDDPQTVPQHDETRPLREIIESGVPIEHSVTDERGRSHRFTLSLRPGVELPNISMEDGRVIISGQEIVEISNVYPGTRLDVRGVERVLVAKVDSPDTEVRVGHLYGRGTVKGGKLEIDKTSDNTYLIVGKGGTGVVHDSIDLVRVEGGEERELLPHVVVDGDAYVESYGNTDYRNIIVRGKIEVGPQQLPRRLEIPARRGWLARWRDRDVPRDRILWELMRHRFVKNIPPESKYLKPEMQGMFFDNRERRYTMPDGSGVVTVELAEQRRRRDVKVYLKTVMDIAGQTQHYLTLVGKKGEDIEIKKLHCIGSGGPSINVDARQVSVDTVVADKVRLVSAGDARQIVVRAQDEERPTFVIVEGQGSVEEVDLRGQSAHVITSRDIESVVASGTGHEITLQKGARILSEVKGYKVRDLRESRPR